MQQSELIQITTEFVKEQLKDAEPGHDWSHTFRVLSNSRYIQSKEGGDLELIELAALLHDVADHKFNAGDTEIGPNTAYEFLCTNNFPEVKAREVASIIAAINYEGPADKKESISLEHCIVQDADRLDAIGAIGIARTFSFGGFFKHPMLDLEVLPRLDMNQEQYQTTKSSTINHFYEKLLKVQEKMLTKTGKNLQKGGINFWKSI